MEVLLDYGIDIAEVGVGGHTLQAILITKFINCERSVRSTAHGKIISIIPLFTHWKITNCVFIEGGISVICSHQIGKFRKPILCYELKLKIKREDGIRR